MSAENATGMRVVSLLPAATDTVVALGLESCLVGRSHECDWQQLASLPVVTDSRVGCIPVSEIDAAFSASVAAVAEMAALGPALAVPLLEYGLSVYHLHTERLTELRPDVILTCLQTAHSAILDGDLQDAALRAVLGYVPRVVHCEAMTLEGVWGDMMAVAGALRASEKGAELVAGQRQAMERISACGKGRGRPRVACIQWPRPLMAASAWVPEMLRMCGADDVVGETESARVLSGEDLANSRPDVIIFALCGLTLRQSLKTAQQVYAEISTAFPGVPAVEAKRVAVVDGEHVLSRPGLLLTASLECLVEILYSEAQAFGHEGTLWEWLPAV